MNLEGKAQIIADHITLGSIQSELAEAEETKRSSETTSDWLEENITVLKKAIELAE